jgi:hypothetical protein
VTQSFGEEEGADVDKPFVFISHITPEAQLAELFKEQIGQDFLGMIDVFVSSDGASISVGSKWLNDIDAALKNAKVELIICSEESVKRPWINFEAGAGWVKGIPIVPICHTGLRPVDLPIPLNMLQGIGAADPDGLKQMYTLLAKQLGCVVPNQSFVNFIRSVQAFEHDYGVVRRLRHHVGSLIKLLPELREIFQPAPVHKRASGSVKDIQLDKMKPHLDALQTEGYLNYSTGGSVVLAFGGPGGGGVMLELKIEVRDAYYTLASKVVQGIA